MAPKKFVIKVSATVFTFTEINGSFNEPYRFCLQYIDLAIIIIWVSLCGVSLFKFLFRICCEAC